MNCLKKGLIFGEDFKFHRGCVEIVDGIITAINISDEEDVCNEKEVYIIPGLVDIHMHGCLGIDFCNASADDYSKMAEYEKSHGVTNFLPTTMTLGLDELIDICTKFSLHSRREMLGINLEGPFIAVSKAGAQNVGKIIDIEISALERLQNAANGAIKLVTIAPEKAGALECIKKKCEEFVFSIGHSEADYETAKEAMDNGAKHVTHLYNAMNGYHHRDPGIVGAAADNNDVYVEIICDGQHVHPSVIKTAFRMFEEDRIIFVSDSCAATGMKDGEYKLGDVEIIKTGSKAVLKEDGKTLAGSVSNLFDCFRTAVLDMHIPIEKAIRAVTYNPASSVGLNNYGVIKEGEMANLIIMDSALNIKEVIA